MQSRGKETTKISFIFRLNCLEMLICDLLGRSVFSGFERLFLTRRRVAVHGTSSPVRWLLQLHCADKVARYVVLDNFKKSTHTYNKLYKRPEISFINFCFVLFQCVTFLQFGAEKVFTSPFACGFNFSQVCWFSMFIFVCSSMSITLLVEQNVFH